MKAAELNQKQNSQADPCAPKKLVIACDMDDCCASPYLESVMINKQNHLLSIFKKIVDDNGGDAIPEIIVQAASNRKDSTKDQANAERNETKLTEEVLEVIATGISSFAEDAEERVRVDKRLHVTQLFPSAAPQRPYECCLYQLSNDLGKAAEDNINKHSPQSIFDMDTSLISKQMPSPLDLYGGRAPAGDQKLDIVLTLAMQYASEDEQVVIAFFDDRFYDDASENQESLQAMTTFLAEDPSIIPSNVTLKFYKLDMHAMEIALDNIAMPEERFLENVLSTLSEREAAELVRGAIGKVDRTIASEMLRALKDQTHAAVIKAFIKKPIFFAETTNEPEQSLMMFCFELLSTRLRNIEFRHDRDQLRQQAWNTMAVSAQEALMAEVFSEICQIQGSGELYISITDYAFWHEVLCPAGMKFLNQQERKSADTLEPSALCKR